jgi:hypothetical protein
MTNAQPYDIERLNGAKPIITQEMFRQTGVPNEGHNINGPSVIRVPDWLGSRLTGTVVADAKYFMYFGNHGGQYIRMAYAENIEGPWKLYQTGKTFEEGERGVLDLGADRQIDIGNNLRILDHIASPRAYLDHTNKEVRLYFHAPSQGHDGVKVRGNNQKTFSATSINGLEFKDGIEPVIVSFAYHDTFIVDGHPHAVASRGSLYRALDPQHPFTPPENWDFGRELWEAEGKHPSDNPFQNAINAQQKRGELSEEIRRCRHFFTRVIGDKAEFYYTRVGDAPERILMSVVDLDADSDGRADPFTEWKPSFPPHEILKPEVEWEGVEFPVKPSKPSAKSSGVRQLRDPYVLEDEDGSLYLFYTGQGEMAIGVARLIPTRQ